MATEKKKRTSQHRKLCPFPRGVDIRVCSFCSRTRLRCSATNPPDAKPPRQPSLPFDTPKEPEP